MYVNVNFMSSNLNVEQFRNKKKIFLHEHLQEAILSGRVKNEYQCPEPKRDRETLTDYIQRVREESLRYQFVSVTDANKQLKYVCFGVAGPIITRDGDFFVVPAEVVGGEWGIHYFLFYPDLQNLKNRSEVMVRIDSGCFSGMVLGDVTCDCLKQLRKAQALCVKNKGGMIIEIPGHDGRGWGEYKMANQKIMNELKMDTIETASMFYGSQKDIDQRTYTEAALILKALGFGVGQSLDLATSNPFKINAFKEFGFRISDVKSVKHKTKDKVLSRNIQAKLDFWKQLGSADYKEDT
jgi:GTP cyclohydrolase II